MKGLLCLLFLWAGWAHGSGMGYDDARHLLVRSGFAPTVSELDLFATLSRQQAVDRILSGTLTEARVAPPQWVLEALPPRQEVQAMPQEQRRQFVRETIRRGFELRAWWYQEMLQTSSPLTERMTLF